MERQYRTTEPFHLEGAGERASTELLLIHGFTGSPSEFRRMGYYMNDLGYSVRGILLPGHGTTPEDMIRTGLADWSRHVVDCFDAIREQGGPNNRIVAVGHSMGGLLALKLAMERPLAGVVSLAAPIFLASRKTALAVLLQYFVKYVERRPTVPPHIIEEACSYSRTPIPCVVDLRKLLKHVKTSLNEVKAPLFIGQGEGTSLSCREVRSTSTDMSPRPSGRSPTILPPRMPSCWMTSGSRYTRIFTDFW